MTRRRLAGIVTAVVLLSSVGSISTAHTYRARTRTSAHYNPDTDVFRGRLRSPRTPCIGRRFVQLVTEGGHVAGIDYSNRRGRWRIEVENPPSQTYTVLVNAVTKRNTARHFHRCKRTYKHIDV